MAEIQRLLQAVDAAPAERAHRLHWSAWRLAHQATAQRGHRARRSRQTPPADTQPARGSAVPGTPLLPDALWVRLLPLLPAPASTGRPPSASRPLVAGLFWMMHHGASWREIPGEHGSWHTLYSRYQRWRRTGVWAQITAALQDSTATGVSS